MSTSDPLYARPIGVRAVATITASGMKSSSRDQMASGCWRPGETCVAGDDAAVGDVGAEVQGSAAWLSPASSSSVSPGKTGAENRASSSTRSAGCARAWSRARGQRCRACTGRAGSGCQSRLPERRQGRCGSDASPRSVGTARLDSGEVGTVATGVTSPAQTQGWPRSPPQPPLPSTTIEYVAVKYSLSATMSMTVDRPLSHTPATAAPDGDLVLGQAGSDE